MYVALLNFLIELTSSMDRTSPWLGGATGLGRLNTIALASAVGRAVKFTKHGDPAARIGLKMPDLP